MKIAITGTVYVGLVAGAGPAETGDEVCCADVDARKAAALHDGILPIHEPGLDETVRYEPGQMATLGFDYHSLGRPSVTAHEVQQ